MNAEHDLVMVYVSQGPLAAQVAKGKLESLGISALLRYEAIGRILGLTVDGLGRVEVWVPRDLADQAREVLQELLDAPSDVDRTDSGGPRPHELQS